MKDTLVRDSATCSADDVHAQWQQRCGNTRGPAMLGPSEQHHGKTTSARNPWEEWGQTVARRVDSLAQKTR